MNRPLLTYGRTLVKRMTHERAYDLISRKIIDRRVIGHVSIAVSRTENPTRMDVDATFHDLSAEEALDALAIAAARIGVLHGVPASNAVAPGTDEADALVAMAERLVDRLRVFGMRDRVAGWLKGTADFRVSREQAVRDVVDLLVRQRQPVIILEAAE